MRRESSRRQPARVSRRLAPDPLALVAGSDPDSAAVLERAARARGFRWRVVGHDEPAPGGDPAEVVFLLGSDILAHAGELRQWARTAILVVDSDHAPSCMEVWRDHQLQVLYKPVDCRFVEAVLDELASEFELRLRYADERALPLDRLGRLNGASPVMQKLHRRMRTVAAGDRPVLIYGEPGTGRYLAARTLHDLSERAAGPFVSVNCGGRAWKVAEPVRKHGPSLADAGDDWSERLGRAVGGTLFLNEICGMPVPEQEALVAALDVMQSVPARLMASCFRDPVAAIRDRQLSQTLYDRLAKFVLRVPPLRERGDDVIGLAHLFLDEQNERRGHDTSLTGQAMEMLRRYPWPGNTAELKRAIEHAHAAAGETGAIHPPHLPASVRAYNVLERSAAGALQGRR